ncbi:MAG: Lon protease family protein [Hyphomicrobium sp.]|uniref:Lon protease family protein n=1 Tax=Hyphomicrobium sp. TaxID=82 RepID=UPI003D0A5B97
MSDKDAPVIEAKVGVQPLPATDLRRSVEAKQLGYKTTADLEPAKGLAGHDRAGAAIDFGLSMKARDFNIFVVGPPSSGRSAAVRAHLAKIAAASQTPSDWVYVTNFEDLRRPRALSLPASRAPALAQGMAAALADLAAALPAAFGSDDYRARRRAIEEEYRATQDDAVDAVHARAAQQNIAVLRTPLGFGMAPMHDGKVVRAEVFSQLPEPMRRDVEHRIAALQTELEAILANAPKAEKHRRQQIAKLNAEATRHVIEAALEPLSASFSDVPDVAAFIALAETDLIANAALFAEPEAARKAAMGMVDPAQDPRLRRYLVNVVVTQKDAKAGAPILEVPNPTLANLAGHVDQAALASDGSGGRAADVLSIRPGALHRANGGALLIEASRALAAPDGWSALKRALEGGEIRIEPAPAADVPAIEPEPIPLAIKVVLFVDHEQLAKLEQSDPAFAQLFKVQADFEDAIGRSSDNDRLFGRLVASVIEAHGLKPMEAGGVARLMEEAARLAEDRDKLAIDVGRIADIVREADYWAEGESRKSKAITAEDIVRALRERTRRVDRLREHAQETVERGVVLIDTAGKKTGQVNALSLVQKGQTSFGRPARVTARVHLGQGRITDIEREVKLGGPLHSKGVMILWGFLAGRFAQEMPLALAASLVFEQSYEAIEGDSASTAELIALLSALADTPARQDIAVTGSVNQWGEVQAVGGTNEKIEGFFDICSARGLSGTQGVVIPDANRQNLMLREDVVTAVRQGRFSIYAIKSIDEGVQLITGLEAGEKGWDGRFGADTVNGRVEARLKAFAERARAFASPAGKTEGKSQGQA